MTAGRLAWSLWGLVMALVVTQAAFAVSQGDATFVLLIPVMGVFATVGALLGQRRPRNPIGWLLLVAAAAFVLSDLARLYAESGDGPRSVAGGEHALWLADWLYGLWPALVGIFVPLLFPNGRLPSARWRPLAWIGVASISLAIVGGAFGSGGIDTEDGRSIDAPLAAPGALGDALELVGTIGQVLFVIGVLGSLCAVVVRLRRARGIERQQVKWFASVMALALAGLIVAVVTSSISEEGAFFYIAVVAWFVFLVALLIALPLAIGIAILRHRLYDIDLVINRALVYGSLTAILAGAYIGLVLLLGLALGPLTNQSDLAIALSTLAVAALFQPVRRRVQVLVDRRFYRHKYDAARTLERFGARLRSETDLDALRAELTGVVRETMRPAHVSLWLREAGR